MAEMFDNTIKKDRVLLAAVDTGSYDVELSLDELEELTETAGGEVIARVTQKRPSFDSGTCIGSGRLEEMAIRSFRAFTAVSLSASAQRFNNGDLCKEHDSFRG